MLRTMLIVVLGLLGILILFIIGCLVFGVIRYKNLTYQITTIEGKVVKKEFLGDETFEFKGKVHKVPIYNEFLVTVLIDGKEIELDDADLFSKVEVGQTIKIKQHSGYNSKGQIRHEYYESA